jgi:hypothetical protein
MVRVQVVCIITFHQEFPKILRAARDILGKDYSKYTFFVGGTPVQEVLNDNEEAFNEEPELRTMMEGMIGISATLDPERARELKVWAYEQRFCLCLRTNSRLDSSDFTLQRFIPNMCHWNVNLCRHRW